MKLRKLLAVTAVAATMTAAFAVNAMADTTNNLEQGKDFTYDASTGIITITADGQAKQHTTGDPYTMLVVVNDMDPLEDKSIPFDTSFIDSDIKQIDQTDAKFEKITVGTLDPGTYEIRLGGDGNVRWGTLEVKGADPEPESPYDDPTRLLGDTDGTKDITGNDALQIVLHVIGNKTLEGDALQSADTDGTLDITGNDALQITLKVIGNAASTITNDPKLSDRAKPVPTN